MFPTIIYLEDQISLVKSDLFKSVANEQFDIIITNPPYVSQYEMKTLPQEYRHEPTIALEASDNGLHFVDIILAEAKHYLTNEGILVLEVGNTEDALVEKYPQVPFLWLEFERGGHGVFLLTKAQLEEHF